MNTQNEICPFPRNGNGIDPCRAKIVRDIQVRSIQIESFFSFFQMYFIIIIIVVLVSF